MLIPIKDICGFCKGTGSRLYGGDGVGNHGELVTCTECSGTGIEPGVERVLDNTFDDDILAAIAALVVKVDAIKTMLDSPLIGMQKTSSNLDDIMVKLDV